MKKKYILYVDDEAMNRELVEAFLEDEFEVGLVDDGYACLESVTERKPDLILLDVMMPVMSGPEICMSLKAQSETQAIPVIYVTGMADSDTLSELTSGLAEDVLTKPFSRSQVKEIIKKYIA